MRRLATVCARAGSKGAPDKNIRVVGGKPLLAHAVGCALASGLFDAVAVSSDSEAYLEIGRQAGAGHLIRRPAEFATDTAGKIPAIRHCMLEVEAATGGPFDIVVDLDVTTPLRAPDDIAGAVALLERERPLTVLSANEARKSPYFNLVEVDGRGRAALSKPTGTAIKARQAAPRVWELNGAVYVWWRHALMDHEMGLTPDTLIHEMPAERGWDIDSELDFAFVEFLFQRRR
ncbi:cytidylyltransferase domain-containing protein [Magnetospirillum sp. UT-4]|uniref:acylneuraminate cytidylyltransferase family protein n=1 Tax=Magnetospirillum sp. UT-4 TaxID=2681467 RepID=UPI00137D7276|nr:acylneuraminate cytidylyltransferase family protein [Magnetospirillum sp. UT-4]CAA7621670.1 CMP-N-acetylneuraminic acid synthetase [Magnetospirillum sp. UT-4]